MTYLFDYLTATRSHQIVAFCLKTLAIAALTLHAFLLIPNQANAQNPGKSLFSSKKAKDGEGQGSRSTFSFTKTGRQLNCNYVSYKMKMQLRWTHGTSPSAAEIANMSSLILNFKDTLPNGLQVTSANIAGDIIGGPVVAIGTTTNPNDTVSIPGIRFDTAPLEAGGTSLFFDVGIVARIDHAAFPAPQSVDNQAELNVIVPGFVNKTITSHDPSIPDDGDPFNGSPTSILIDVTDCDDTPPGDGDRPEEEACFILEEGEIDCSKEGDGTFTYKLPMGPEMGGRSVELVPLTPGITVDPESQIVPIGGGVLEWTITGALPGDVLSFTIVGTEISAGPEEGWGLCCAQVVEIVIPEDIDCPDRDKEPDLKVEKRALVSECRIDGGCRFRITVTNVGDAPYTGPIVLDEIVTQGPAQLEGPPNAPWSCVPGTTPMVCSHPVTTLNPDDSVTLDVSLRHLTRRRWTLITNCASIDWDGTAGGISFGDLTDDKACASIPIRYPRDPQDPKKADLRILKRANSQQCDANGVCTFTILITNTGPSTYTGKLKFEDNYTTGAPLSSTFQPSPPWICSSIAADRFSCETAGNVTLVPGASVAVTATAIVSQTSYPGREIENCVNLSPIPNEIDLTNNKACDSQRIASVDRGDPKLTIEKTCSMQGSGQTTAPNSTLAQCTISVTNTGTASATGRVVVSDTARLISNGQPLDLQGVSPDGPEWECEQPSGSSLRCEIPGPLLTPGTTRSFDVSVSFGRQRGIMENCATAASVPIGAETGQNIGESCAQAGIEPPKQCSSNLVLNDAGRCVCLEGTRYKNGKCIGRDTTPIPPPPPQLCKLIPGQIRTADGRCVCTRGTVINNRGTACINPPKDPKLCKLLPGQIRTKANQCVCRRGTVLNRSRTACVRKPQQCNLLPGQIRTKAGQCVCRRGTILNRSRTACVRKPQQCNLLPGQIRTKAGQCVCRRGTILNRSRTACVRKPQQCNLLPGQIRTKAGQCVCRRGTILNRSRTACVRKPQLCKLVPGQIRTKAGRCVCRRGTVLNQRRTACIRPRVPCPRGTVGKYQPNCKKVEVRIPCPSGTIGRFQPNCRKIIRKRCPRGTVGTFQPNCRKIVRKRCPRGTVGTFQPNCRKIVRKRCPRGTVGTFQPNCRKIVRKRCPRGTVGTFQPNCRRIGDVVQ